MNITREVPELKLPLLFGIFGSAFCATLNHYYDEIRPFLVSLGWGLQTVDDLISQVGNQDYHLKHFMSAKHVLQRRHSLKMVHAFEPACIPNYVKGMGDQLPPTCPVGRNGIQLHKYTDNVYSSPFTKQTIFN